MQRYTEPLPFNQTVFAPGKLVIGGEYAVIDGGPAIVMAIDKGVKCDILPGNGIITPDGDSRFVKSQLQQLSSTKQYRFSNWNPIDLDGAKPGFGGSAAACVAACVAAGMTQEDALAIHHQVQGSGSGIDILACINGGLCFYDSAEKNRQHHSLEIKHVPVIVWSGNSARTGPRVIKYQKWRQSNDLKFFERSAEHTLHFREDPVAHTKSLLRNLIDMCSNAGILYLTPALKIICNLADEMGGAAKPSGAGGGDCAVAWFKSIEDATSYIQQIHSLDFRTIQAKISPGVFSQPIPEEPS